VQIEQILEFPKMYAGKTLTFSVKYRSNAAGALLCFPQQVYTIVSSLPISETWRTASGTVTIPETAETFLSFAIALTTPVVQDAYISIESVKLELGSVSTFANDPPADYGVELAKCQRFFQGLPTGSTFISGFYMGGGNCMFTLPMPSSMRVSPVIANINTDSNIGGVQLVGGGPTYAISSVSVASFPQSVQNSAFGFVTLQVIFMFSSMPPTGGVVALLNLNRLFGLSADL
jgi:hypothetical protein